MADPDPVEFRDSEELDPLDLPIRRTGLSRPVSFVRSTEKPQSVSISKPTQSTGDQVADLYKSIISASSTPPSQNGIELETTTQFLGPSSSSTSSSASIRPYCDNCQKHISEDTMKEHIRTMAHMVCAEYLDSADFLTLNGTNVGFRMLQSQGWEYEQGLGAEGKGRRHPVATVLKKDRSGIGHKKESKRITHTWEETEKEVKKELPQPPSGKEMARSARREARKRVAMLRYMNN